MGKIQKEGEYCDDDDDESSSQGHHKKRLMRDVPRGQGSTFTIAHFHPLKVFLAPMDDM